MRSETSHERIFDENRAYDSGGLQTVGFQRDISKSTSSSSEVPRSPKVDVTNYLNLARKLASSFSHSEEYEELVCVCNLALVKASYKFNPDLGYKFSTYAYYAMRNAIYKHLEKKGRSVPMGQLDSDVVCHRSTEIADPPQNLSSNEGHIYRLRILGYNHLEIKEKLDLTDTLYSKELTSLRRKIVEQET